MSSSATTGDLSAPNVGVVVGILGLAFTGYQVRFPTWIFCALLGGAGLVLLAPMRIAVPKRLRRKPPDPGLLGQECRRVAADIERLLTEQRACLFAGPSVKEATAWKKETERRFVEELQNWALSVFDEAAKYQVVTRGARGLIKHPRVEQLEKVRDLFREAANSLEDR